MMKTTIQKRHLKVFFGKGAAMEYLKIQEVAEKWGISVRSVQLMCSSGKIEGAVRFGCGERAREPRHHR